MTGIVPPRIQRTVRELQPLRRLRILCVDSDRNGRERIEQVLGNSFTVQCAASVEEAYDYLEAEVPDVLICEVLLGQESGLELCRAIRTSIALRHLPIMLLTSLTTFRDKVAGFDAGADDYVVKPFDPRHLVARIRLLSRIKRIEQSDQGTM